MAFQLGISRPHTRPPTIYQCSGGWSWGYPTILTPTTVTHWLSVLRVPNSTWGTILISSRFLNVFFFEKVCNWHPTTDGTIVCLFLLFFCWKLTIIEAHAHTQTTTSYGDRLPFPWQLLTFVKILFQCKTFLEDTVHYKKAIIWDMKCDIFQCEVCFSHVAKCDYYDFILLYSKGNKFISPQRTKFYNHVMTCQRNMERMIEE